MTFYLGDRGRARPDATSYTVQFKSLESLILSDLGS